ncbi:hypothetical protein CBR_g46773 [Chara braunii]|uniref:Integrase catalytic domain-containing protein n=1 Tax=Chara braunii TaxID=69332 RepID=A0A388K450_CHABU|nr:hypothetical protein CBR_g46773 [Chara braunii]|eukprot:GBG64817.1 hypothetical protein CBR_g46773 [Chara braunii]
MACVPTSGSVGSMSLDGGTCNTAQRSDSFLHRGVHQWDRGLYAYCLIVLPLFPLSLPSPYSVTTGTSQVPHQFTLMSMEQDTGALPRRSARLAVRSRPVVPPTPKQRLSKRKTPAASCTAITVPSTTGVLPTCPVQGAGEPMAAYLQRVQAFTNAVATAKAQEEAAEAERQRLANEAAAQAQQTAEADAVVRDKPNAICMESLTMNESEWTTLLQGMLFVPSETQADPTPAEEERSNLDNLMLNMMRAIMWNNTMLMVQIHEGRQLRQIQQNDSAALTAAVRAAATHQQQQQQLLNTTTARVNNIDAKASAAPGCTTDATKQLNERIDHVVTIIDDIGNFTSPATISSAVAAIKTDITKLRRDRTPLRRLTRCRTLTSATSCRTVPADDMMKALYLQLIGGAQAWMNHLAATKKCTIAELRTHILWKEFEKLWLTRFMVRNVVKATMNEVYICSQGSMPTRDWTTKWQKIVNTPGFDLSFTNQRSEFFSRSCAGLRSTLNNEYDYDSFQAILDRANLVIQTDDKAANEWQSQPHYVAKQGYQRPAHNNAVIYEETVDLHAKAASSSDGGFVAALLPKRPKRVWKNKATQETTSTGNGQQPWTAYKITKDVYDLRQKLEELDTLTRENFAWMPLPSTGTLPRPHCNVLIANLRSYFHTTVPAPLTDDGVAVVDLRSYLAKIDREYPTQRYAETDAPLLNIRIQIGKATCSALIDCGASRNFMSQVFMARAGLGPRLRRKTQPTQVTLADGRTQKSIDRCVDGVPVYFAPLACEPVSFDILDTKFDMILAMSWLRSADHPVNFHDRTVHIRDRNEVLVPCTVATPHTSIACHVVSVARIRDAIARNDVEEMGLVFLHALPSPDGPAASPPNPRISHLLDEYRDVFEAPTGTNPDRPIRHGITLEAGAVPPRGCIYRMSEEELEVLRAQLDDLLDKGWIRPSCSPYGAPVLFVRKKNKDLQIEVQPQDRYKAVFKTRYGHFEWVVMPFGLTNAPATFQAFMTTEFRDSLDRSVLIYLDDILVYSRTLDEHITHLRAVLNCLRLAKYKANRDKCEFAKQELEYLGHYVTPKGIRPLADKIQAIVDWPEPRCTTDVRSFMGLAGYYQRFVESYSKVAAPLSRLQSPKVPFEFDDAARGAFTTLKAAMQAAPALRIYDPTLATQVTTDASGYGIGAVLEQCHEDGWHPVEYFSQKVPLVNTLVDARKKELLAFVTVLKRWRHFILGRRRFKWNTDNNPLTFYKTQDTVTSTIGRWMYYIDQFDFDPCHIPGPANRAADALSRRPNFCAIVTTTFDLDDNLQPHFVKGYKSDPSYSTLYAELSLDHPPASHFRIFDGFLLLHTRGKDSLVVPQDRIVRTPAELARLLHIGWITNQGVPEDIVSDRDTRFMSTFWTSLMAESGTTMKPSSARHPQTDDQTEQAHQTAQMMLRTLIRPDQKDWVDRLPDVEFAYNTSVHPAICVTPFELHHGGEKARIFADLLLPQAADIDVPCSPASVRKYRDLLIKARANTQKAQIRMQEQANRRRLPCPFREGDLVWVLSEEFALEQDVSRKLLPKWFGPWEVTSAVRDDPTGPSFVINIPPHLTVHRVFHASKLAIHTPPSVGEFPGRRSQDPPSMDGHQEVNRVITHCKYGNKPMQYKVTFKQCAPDDTRWISSADLQTSAPLIFANYEKTRLAKAAARPTRPIPVGVVIEEPFPMLALDQMCACTQEQILQFTAMEDVVSVLVESHGPGSAMRAGSGAALGTGMGPGTGLVDGPALSIVPTLSKDPSTLSSTILTNGAATASAGTSHDMCSRGPMGKLERHDHLDFSSLFPNSESPVIATAADAEKFHGIPSAIVIRLNLVRFVCEMLSALANNKSAQHGLLFHGIPSVIVIRLNLVRFVCQMLGALANNKSAQHGLLLLRLVCLQLCAFLLFKSVFEAREPEPGPLCVNNAQCTWKQVVCAASFAASVDACSVCNCVAFARQLCV